MLLFLVFFPMLAAVCGYLIGRKDKKLRDRAVQIFCLIEFGVAAAAMGLVVAGKELSAGIPGFCGFGLSFKLDGFRALYALVAGVMWLMTSLLSGDYFAHHYRNRNRYYFFFLLTQGATVGVFLSADLFTTFIFFEIMSFTSYTWVAHDETPGAMRAAETYLAVAIIGGMVMLMGLFLLWNAVGTLAIDELYEAAKACPNKGRIWAASICILFGFGAKAGMFPLHIWLPKAHPVAPAPASALLSGILTKSGIFGVIVVSANIFRASTAWGNLILALLYMVNHSLFKLILFMAAGVVYMNLHKLNLNDVRGFGRKKPILHFAFLMGAVGLMGVPGFSGYVSKTLIHEGIVEYAELLAEEGMGALALLYRGAEWIYLFSGGLTGFVADLLARKVLSARKKKPENNVGNAITRAVGGVFDGMAEGLNHTVLRGHQIEHHAMARISAVWDGIMDAVSQMSHTMSYGLLLFGLGLCVTLLYLMFY